MEQPQEQPQDQTPPPPRPRRLCRVLWWGGALCLLLLLAGLAVPFVFTTQLVRYALRQTHGEFAPAVDRATLGFSGLLTLNGLRLHEPADPARPLLTAERLRIHFDWGAVRHKRLETVDARGLRVHLRADERHPLTLLRLVPADTDEPAFWFDRLTADGVVIFERPGGWSAPVEQLPMDLEVRMGGTQASPIRRIRLALGASDQSPRLLAVAQVDEKTIRLEQLTARDIAAAIPAEVARKYIAGIPQEVGGPLRLSADAVELAGTVALDDPRMPMLARGEVRDLSVTAPDAPEGHAADVQGVTAAFVVGLPLASPSLAELSVSGARARFDALRYGPHLVQAFGARWSVKDGVLATEQLRLNTLRSTIEGSASFNLATGVLAAAKLEVDRLDLGEAAARLMPGRFDLRGIVTGSVDIRPDSQTAAAPLRVVVKANVRDLAAAVPAELAREHLADLPPEITGPLHLVAEGIDLNGQVTLGDERLPATVGGQVRGLSFSSPQSPAGSVPALVGLAADFSIRLPLKDPKLPAIAIESRNTRFESLDHGPLQLRSLAADWSLKDQVLQARKLRVAMGSATVEGDASFDLGANVLREMTVDVTTLDVRQLMANLALERFGAEGTVSGRFAVRSELDPATRRPLRYSGQAAIRQLAASVPSSAIRPHLPEMFKELTGPVRLSADGLDLKGTLSLDDPRLPLTARGAVRGLFLSTPEARKENMLALRQLEADITLEVPLAEPSLENLELASDSTRFESLVYGGFDVRNFSAEWSLWEQAIHAERAQWNMYKAAMDGRLRFNFATGVIHEALFKLQRLDLHELVKNLLPGKMDARGLVSGTIELQSDLDPQTGRPTPLRGEVKLVADSPGQLMIGDVKPLQDALVQDKSEELTDVILAQLRNYPYESGSVTLTAASGQPELILSFRRNLVQPGEPGHNALMDYGGRKVTVNYTVQISHVVIAMPQQTLDSILLLASGLRVGDLKQRR